MGVNMANRIHYYLFRYGESSKDYGYRIGKGRNVREACKEAFGSVYAAPYNGNVVYKDLGTRSPAYITQKIQKTWYSVDGWQVIR